jgi:hypothetical protein
MNPCHNRPPFASTLRIQDGWTDSGPSRFPVMKAIPFRMTPGCIYSTDPLIGQHDPGCIGCQWKQQTEA